VQAVWEPGQKYVLEEKEKQLEEDGVFLRLR
jgi:hypothetical protein